MYRVDMPYRCIDNRNNNIIPPIILYKKNEPTLPSRALV